jgi:phosphoribosyl 1,2-cyclic phosphodiesterase
MRVRILASGSGGNASLYETDDFSLLVDAGIDPTLLAARLRALGAGYAHPDAVVITHGHADHSRYAAHYAAKFKIPVYVTDATARLTGLTRAEGIKLYSNREAFACGPYVVSPTPLPHDAAQVALKIHDGQHAAVIATDLGEPTAGLLGLINDATALLIESNHDRDMLERGPYPRALKRRVASAKGHLSNAQTFEFLQQIPRGIDHVVLMHLSEKNNTPHLALESATEALADHPAQLLAAKQEDHLVLELGGASTRSRAARPIRALTEEPQLQIQYGTR